jgi:hypothetical protein
MHQQFIILIGIMLLAMGTYLIRYAGLSLGQYFTITQQREQLFNDAATTLLFSIAILSTFFEGADWADLGKIMGGIGRLISDLEKPLTYHDDCDRNAGHHNIPLGRIFLVSPIELLKLKKAFYNNQSAFLTA